MRTLVLSVTLLRETERRLEILNQIRNREKRQVQRLVSQLAAPSLIDVQRVASKRHVVLVVIAVLYHPNRIRRSAAIVKLNLLQLLIFIRHE